MIKDQLSVSCDIVLGKASLSLGKDNVVRMFVINQFTLADLMAYDA
jgi:hypothetical protein